MTEKLQKVKSCRAHKFLTLIAPCWPQDFQWSNTGYPQNCGCGGEQQPGTQEQPKEDDKNDKKCKLCKCLAIKTKRSPKSWQHNHFCHKAGKHDPNFILMRNGMFC